MLLEPALLAFAITSGLAQDAIPNVAEIEEKVLANRRAIKQAHVEFDSVLKRTVAGETTLRKRSVTLWIDAKRLRQDTLRINQTNDATGKRETYRSINCFSDNEHLVWSDLTTPSGGKLAVTVSDAQRASKNRNSVIDPRLLGLGVATSANLLHFHLESFFANPARREPKVSRTRLGDIDCFQTEYIRLNDVVERAWIAPSMGFGVLRMETQFKSKSGRTYLDSIQTELRESAPGIWFPQECRYQRLIDGRHAQDEVLTIRVLGINEPIDAKIFTLAGMNVPPGTNVSRMEGNYVWDGEKLLPRPRPSPDAPPASEMTHSSRMYLGTLTLGIVLAGIGSAVILSYCVKRGTFGRDRNWT